MRAGYFCLAATFQMCLGPALKGHVIMTSELNSLFLRDLVIQLGVRVDMINYNAALISLHS